MVRASIRRRIQYFGFSSSLLCRDPSVSPGRFEESSKASPSDSAPLPQGAFPQSDPWKGRISQLCPALYSYVHNKTKFGTFQPAASKKDRFPSEVLLTHSLTEAELLAQEKDLCTAIAFPSLNMWGSKFLASLTVDEAFTPPSSS